MYYYCCSQNCNTGVTADWEEKKGGGGGLENAPLLHVAGAVVERNEVGTQQANECKTKQQQQQQQQQQPPLPHMRVYIDIMLGELRLPSIGAWGGRGWGGDETKTE
jgi:hypothetical protein